MATQEEVAQMGLLVSPEVLEDQELKVKDKPGSKENKQKLQVNILTLWLLQVCLEPLVWMDSMALVDLKVSLEPQVKTHIGD